jgi:hypothetical protein
LLVHGKGMLMVMKGNNRLFVEPHVQRGAGKAVYIRVTVSACSQSSTVTLSLSVAVILSLCRKLSAFAVTQSLP